MAGGREWTPVALSASIEPGTSAGAVIGDFEVVIWRDAKGAAHVWEDRCPHRGMRMSFGFVRGDHIACLYHGWQYDAGGQCQYIPAHPDLEVPKTIKIATFVTEERDGLIWTNLAEGADLSVLPESGAPVATPVRSLYLDAPLAAVQPALAGVSLVDESGESHGGKMVSLSSNAFRLSAGPYEVLIACQPARPGKTALHIVILGEEFASAAARKALAKWAEGLRLQIEASAERAEAA